MIILGEEEVKQGVVKIKDMTKRTEEVRPAAQGKAAAVYGVLENRLHRSGCVLRMSSPVSTSASS